MCLLGKRYKNYIKIQLSLFMQEPSEKHRYEGCRKKKNKYKVSKKKNTKLKKTKKT